MFPVLQLGPLAIQTPGLMLLLGLWIGLALAEREAKRLNQDAEAIYNLAFTGIIAGLVGARLSYVARYPAAYAADPLSLISPNPSTLSAVEGLAIAFLAMWIYLTRRKMNLRLTLDSFAPTAAVMAVAIALAHLASGDAFGAPAKVAWSIFLWEEWRHPSQVYELIAALAILLTWWRLPRAGDGITFWIVVALLSAAGLFLEAFRGDSHLFLSFRVNQLWALIILAASLIVVKRWQPK
jgi:prolipoprotein diacylglyceryltransferase